MLRWFLISALVILAGRALPGQMPSYRRLTGRDGLPQSQPQVLMEDRNGFLWVGTHGGVARLGGQGFQTFGGISGLKGNRVSALLEAPDGSVWVGYEDGGLVRIEGDHVSLFGPSQGLEVLDTFSLAVGGDGQVRVGTREGLFLARGSRFERVPLPAPWAQSPIFSLAVDPSGGIWMGSVNGRLGRWDGHALQEATLPLEGGGGDVLALRWDPSGRLWAMGSRGLACRAPSGRWEALPLPGQARPSGLNIDARGEVLVALGTDGLLSLDPQGNRHLLGPRDGIPKEGLFSALRDRGGRLWLGTNGDGLAVRAVPGLVHFGGGQGPDLGGVLAFLEYRPGDLFIGSSRGLFRWQEGRGFVGEWGAGQGLPSPVVRALHADGRGGLWVATTKGLAHWREGRVAAAPAPLGETPITHLQRVGDLLWAATDKGLVCLNERGTQVDAFALPPEAGQRNVYSLRLTREGLLAGTMHGVYRFADGAFQRIWGEAPFASQPISDIREDLEGRCWVATTKGLYVRKEGAWRRLGIAEGLPDELIFLLGDAGRGRMVVGGGKGISILDGENLLTINQNLGLLSDETNQGGVLLDGQRRLWIGMIGGISRLETDLLPARFELPAPMVEEMRWPEGFAAFPKEVRIPPRTRTLDFHWDIGLPASGGGLRYQVRVRGLEQEWRPVEGGHVPYGRLPPGSYEFLLRASLDGVHWAEARPVLFQVQAAWYEYTAGRAIILLFLLGMVAAAVAGRIRHLKRAQIELENKVQERTAALAASERKAREASLAKSTFLANMSHELRTPLNAVLGFAQLMARDPKQKAETQENVGRILRAGEHLLGLINDVLSISKIEAGKIILNTRPFDSHHFIKAIVEMAEVRAQAKDLAFRLEEGAGIPEHLEGDDGKLRQVLLNLVGNAIKFTEAGGVVLRVDYREGRAFFEVEDTGPGMAPEELHELFGAFYQTQTGLRQAEGTGLGLHIGQAMIRLMGGEIRVRSEVGKGSVFSFDVPLPETPDSVRKEPYRKVTGLEPGQRALRLLIVDDRPENRLILVKLFGSIGFATEEAGDGLMAVETWERWAPDVVFMDIRMPKLNGFEALRRIRAFEAERGLPRTTVIALTASAFDHDHDAMLQAGFDDHVGKPFKEASLVESLARS